MSDDTVLRIVACEARADEIDAEIERGMAEASDLRWEAAELMARERKAQNITQVIFAKIINEAGGKSSQTHISYCERAVRDRKPGQFFSEAYKLAKESSCPSSEDFPKYIKQVRGFLAPTMLERLDDNQRFELASVLETALEGLK